MPRAFQQAFPLMRSSRPSVSSKRLTASSAATPLQQHHRAIADRRRPVQTALYPCHVVVNNSYLGLIRQAQRGFDMDYCVQLAFENVNCPEINDYDYGVDLISVVECLGCKALRVTKPEDIAPALEKARELMREHRVPVVVEIILERVTNISMGTDLDGVNEFEELAENVTDAPSSIASLT